MRDGTLVLLWGLESDPPLAAVREQLHSLGVANEFVDQRKILDTDVQLNVGESIDASLRIRKREIDLNEVTAIYVRPYDSYQLPEIANAGPQSLGWQHATEVDDILASWSENHFGVRCQSAGSHGFQQFKTNISCSKFRVLVLAFLRP